MGHGIPEPRIIFATYHNTGLITKDTSFFNQIIKGFQDACQQHCKEVHIRNLEHSAPTFAKEAERLTASRSDAVFLIGAEMITDDFTLFQQGESTLLTMDYSPYNTKSNSILVNNESAAHQAIDYFVKKGHRKIGHLHSNLEIQPFAARRRGFEKAIAFYNLPTSGYSNVYITPTMDGAYQNMAQYLKINPKLPTAFFADNDIIALGCMKAMEEAGISVPEDISLIGFDDLAFSQVASPPLTTFRVPGEKLGHIAFKRLLELYYETSTTYASITVWPDFIERDSVKQL